MADASPRFSVLTTAYRTEAYLPDAIASVRAQTFEDWELIVVDNGMSDEIADIVTRSAAADSRIRLIRQENRGWAGGVNAAADHARGDYLCPLDSDDELVPRFCAVVDAALTAQPDVDAVAVDIARFVDGQDHDMLGGFRTVPAKGHRLRLRDVLSGTVPYTGAVRRDAWRAIGGLDVAEDVEADILLWARLSADGRVGIVRERLARVRERPTSWSRHTAGIEHFEERMIRSFGMAAGMAASTPADRRAAERAIRNIRYHGALRRGRTALAAGDVETARRAAGDALRLRRTPRAVVARAVLGLPSRPVRRLHRLKQVATLHTRAAAGALATRWRSRRA